jgi:hypothetical protein
VGDATEIQQACEDFPGVPCEYLDFLRNVGSGTIGKSRFQIYGYPMLGSELFDFCFVCDETHLFVGDDFRGKYVGYRIGGKESEFFIADAHIRQVEYVQDSSLTKHIWLFLSAEQLRRLESSQETQSSQG